MWNVAELTFYELFGSGSGEIHAQFAMLPALVGSDNQRGDPSTANIIARLENARKF
jgi:hypothetical protein